MYILYITMALHVHNYKYTYAVISDIKTNFQVENCPFRQTTHQMNKSHLINTHTLYLI